MMYEIKNLTSPHHHTALHEESKLDLCKTKMIVAKSMVKARTNKTFAKMFTSPLLYKGGKKERSLKKERKKERHSFAAKSLTH